MGKIIITGPGRSGTTFLIQLLGRLGFDTGFTPETETYVDEIRAGCEWHVEFDVNRDTLPAIRARIQAAPRVLKTPDWSTVLKWLLMHELVDLEHVLLPLRDIDQAARSRLAVGLDWMVDPLAEGQERIEQQANIMAMALGRTIEAVYLYGIPCHMMRFHKTQSPSIVLDVDYCYARLAPVLEPEGISPEDFRPVWTQLARPSQIQTL